MRQEVHRKHLPDMNAKIERWHPIAVGFVVSVSYYTFLRSHSLPSSTKDIFSSVVSLSGITIGFLATAMSVLYSIDKKYIIQQLKVTGTYKKLINYFLDAIHWSFWLAALSITSLIIDFAKPEVWHSTVFACWLFVLTTAGFSYYRVISTFASILRSHN